MVGGFEEPGAVQIHLVIVDSRRVVAKIQGFAFVGSDPTASDEICRVDKVGVPGEGRKGLVRGIAVAGGAEWEYLPAFLAGGLQPVNKCVGFA